MASAEDMVGEMVERALVQGIERGLCGLKVWLVVAVGRSVGMRQAGGMRGISIGRFEQLCVGTCRWVLWQQDIHSDLPVSSCRRMWLD